MFSTENDNLDIDYGSFAHTRRVSVVVPTLNEEASVAELVKRIAHTLRYYAYEIIFIDDHSSDNTVNELKKLQWDYPIIIMSKQGKPGKAYSLMEGFRLARFELIAMVDADLQYPPEALSPMAEKIILGKADLVVANRKPKDTNLIRTILSKSFRTIFGRFLWGIDQDIQSGLKIFKREIIDRIELNPESGWTFDLEFIIKAKNGGYRLAGYDIPFNERQNGHTKLKVLSAIKQIGLSTLKLRFKPPNYIPFHGRDANKSGQGFHFKGEPYVTHTNLKNDDTAAIRTYPMQRLFLIAILLLTVAAFIINWYAALIVLVSLLTAFYFFDLLFNFYLILKSFYKNTEIKVADRTIDSRTEWPIYTIFCPLYKESAVLPQFVKAMSGLDYPKEKLEIMLLLEEDDEETIATARAMQLPAYFQIQVVPHAMPKTKPKACNYGLLNATGEFAVIYDAEDMPDPQQLKKAAVAFSRVPTNIGCIQAKLNYYNWDQNILTRLFTLEYSLWFNLVLSGLQSIYAPIPLGGTSNHFRVQDLRNFDGWDPFNVTEDADLGMRLAKRGYQTAILDSYTMEEANSEFGNWIKQRSRWIKGYMQTYLVHMRKLKQTRGSKNFLNLLFMQLVIGGKVLSLLINPIFWLTTAIYLFVPGAREFITSLFLGPVFYMGLFCLVFGNFLYMYYYMLGGVKQGKPELNLYALLIPFYWLMMSFAAAYALRDLIVRPHHWHKTKHGLHLKEEPQLVTALETEKAQV